MAASGKLCPKFQAALGSLFGVPGPVTQKRPVIGG